jgi:lipoprotein-releasing system permease protein
VILPIEFYIAWRYIRYNLRQSLIIALAVGIGVGIIIFIPSVNLGFFNSFIDKTVQSMPHIRITKETETMPRNRRVLQEVLTGTELPGKREQILYSDKTLTRRENVTAYRHLMNEIARLPGVVAVSPYINEQVVLVRGNEVRGVQVQGILPEEEKKITNIADDVRAGDLDALTGNEAFLGWRLADEMGVSLGSRVRIVSAKGERSFKVAGLLDTGIQQQDLSTVVIPLKTAQELLQLPNQVTGIGVKVSEIYDAETIAQAIARTYHVKAVSWMEENKVYLDQIGNFRVIIGFINFLIVFAAATSITSVLIMVVSSKSKEIGILKAMGTTPGAIVRLFVTQALFLSILGASAGVLAALGLIALYNATPYSKAETGFGVGREPVSLNLEYTILGIIYAMVSSFLASLFPAWRAGKLDPVKAINQ